MPDLTAIKSTNRPNTEEQTVAFDHQCIKIDQVCQIGPAYGGGAGNRKSIILNLNTAITHAFDN